MLFLNQLGLPKTQIGSLLSLLPFTGISALFIAPSVSRIGLMGGIGPLAAGWFIDRFQDLEGNISFLKMSPYTPLFLLSLFCLATAIIALGRFKTTEK